MIRWHCIINDRSNTNNIQAASFIFKKQKTKIRLKFIFFIFYFASPATSVAIKKSTWLSLNFSNDSNRSLCFISPFIIEIKKIEI